MYSTVRTAVLDGISAIPVQVEVDISTGMPVFEMLCLYVFTAVQISYCTRNLKYLVVCACRQSKLVKHIFHVSFLSTAEGTVFFQLVS